MHRELSAKNCNELVNNLILMSTGAQIYDSIFKFTCLINKYEPPENIMREYRLMRRKITDYTKKEIAS